MCCRNCFSIVQRKVNHYFVENFQFFYFFLGFQWKICDECSQNCIITAQRKKKHLKENVLFRKSSNVFFRTFERKQVRYCCQCCVLLWLRRFVAYTGLNLIYREVLMYLVKVPQANGPILYGKPFRKVFNKGCFHDTQEINLSKFLCHLISTRIKI